MTEGWIKLHRKFREWGWYKDPNTALLFIELLLSANSQSKEWHGLTIERGQLVTGRLSLSQSTGISEQSIRTCLERLKSTNEITIKSTNKYSIITICNYDKYQTSKNEINQQFNQQTNQQLTNNQPTTNHKQEYKNIRSKELNTIVSTKIGFDWNTFKFTNINGKRNVLIEKFPAVDLDNELRRMEAWLMSNPKNKKSNYERFITNWLSRTQDKAPKQEGKVYGKDEVDPDIIRKLNEGFTRGA